MQKYHFLKETKTLPDGREVRRIIAARDFGTIKQGDHGGFLEDTRNLSHEGNCWVSGEAVAAGKSRVTGNALLQDHASIDDYAAATDDTIVSGNAQLREHAFVYDTAIIGGDTLISGCATVCGRANVHCSRRRSLSGKSQVANCFGLAMIRENALLMGHVCVTDNAIVEGDSVIRRYARISGNARVSGDAVIGGAASLSDECRVEGNAQISGTARIGGDAMANGNARIEGCSKILCRAFLFGNAIVRNAIISGDIRCNYEIIKKRRLKPSTTICEPKRGIPASSPQPAAEKAP